MFREASNLLKVIQFVKALELELFQVSVSIYQVFKETSIEKMHLLLLHVGKPVTDGGGPSPS